MAILLHTFGKYINVNLALAIHHIRVHIRNPKHRTVIEDQRYSLLNMMVYWLCYFQLFPTLGHSY